MGSWEEAARGLVDLLPGPAVLLDRDLQVLHPLQCRDGPPVLCSVQLMGVAAECRNCLAERALREDGQVERSVDGRLYRARPLPGGFLVVWQAT